MDISSTTELWFWFGFGGMSLGSLLICLLGTKMKPTHRYHAILAVAVTSIATIAYYALARGQATATIGSGSPYDVLRGIIGPTVGMISLLLPLAEEWWCDERLQKDGRENSR